VVDIALVEHDGCVMAHHPDCPVVQAARAEERPIMTMFGVERDLPDDLEQHECLKPKT
jgi:hypothetical protein